MNCLPAQTYMLLFHTLAAESRSFWCQPAAPEAKAASVISVLHGRNKSSDSARAMASIEYATDLRRQ